MTDGDQGREIVVVVVGGCWSYLKTPRLSIRWNFFWCGHPRRAASPRLASPSLLTRFGRPPPDFAGRHPSLAVLDFDPVWPRMASWSILTWYSPHYFLIGLMAAVLAGDSALGVATRACILLDMRQNGTVRPLLLLGTEYSLARSLPYACVTWLHA